MRPKTSHSKQRTSEAPRTKKYNGRPMAHWEAEAKSLVMDLLIKAAITHEPRMEGPHSIIGELASKQLYALATAIDPRRAREIRDNLYKQRGDIGSYVVDMLADVSGGPVPHA